MTIMSRHTIRCHTLASAAGVALFSLLAAGCSRQLTLDTTNAAQILRHMTTREKIDMVVGAGNDTFTGYGNTKKLVPGAAGTTTPIARWGVGPTVLSDGPAGLRIDTLREGDPKRYYHTGFPIGTALATTWNTPLMEQVGAAIGNEAREYGLDLIFAPGMNLHRDPLGGRNFEYYSEDPLLTGKMAAAYVRGVQSQNVGTSVKHFAVNNQETNRKDVDSRVAQRPLRELYLRAFEIAVKEGRPWAVMSAYNMINGQQCMESRDLLTTVLRRDWGYDGVVISDWAAPGWRDSGKEIWAGNDLLAPGSDKQREELRQALADGSLQMRDLDTCALRMLRFVARTNRQQHYAYQNNPDLKAHAAKALEAAEEGIVLLENREHTLPLSGEVRRVGMFGVASYNFLAVGTGSGNVKTRHTTNLMEGFQHVGVETDPAVADLYQRVIRDTMAARPYDPLGYLAMPEIAVSDEAIEQSAERDDLAVFTLGRSCGEGADRSWQHDYELSEVEKSVISRVSQAFHKRGKRVVVVLNVSGVVEVASWRDQADALVLSWLLGQEGGDAVCRVLTGRATPSGKLTMTWPVAYADCNTHDNFPYDYHGPKAIGNYPKIPRTPARKNVHYTEYAEGMHMGYRYFDTFHKAVAYPFGYGQSYTNFDYTHMSLVRADSTGYEVSITVSNSGKMAGKETVQLYAPVRDVSHSLVAFAKTRLLQPGEQQTLTLRFTPRDLAYFDADTRSWTLSPGDYALEVAASSRDVRGTLTLHVDRRRLLGHVADGL